MAKSTPSSSRPKEGQSGPRIRPTHGIDDVRSIREEAEQFQRDRDEDHADGESVTGLLGYVDDTQEANLWRMAHLEDRIMKAEARVAELDDVLSDKVDLIRDLSRQLATAGELLVRFEQRHYES